MSWLDDYLATAKPHFVDPEHPCRIMPSRACPLSYEGVCGERPCARYESEDEAPWQADMERDKALGLWARPYGVPPVQDPTITPSRLARMD